MSLLFLFLRNLGLIRLTENHSQLSTLLTGIFFNTREYQGTSQFSIPLSTLPAQPSS